jgi:hypothetical protein
MPLFFLMAGFFFRRRFLTWNGRVKNLAFRRLVPVVFFALLALPFWPLDLYLGFGQVRWDLIALRAFRYFLGQPELNTITWFLVCLFTTEVIAGILLPQKRRRWLILLLAALSFRFGLLMTANIKETEVSLGIVKNAWYLHEALVAFGFYALGYASFSAMRVIRHLRPVFRLLLALLALALTLFTYNLNQPYQEFVVILKISEHGFPGLFLLTALTGSSLILLVSTLLPPVKILHLLGLNTMGLIGFSGLFHEFFNPILLRFLPIPDTTLGVTLSSLAITLVSLTVSLPVVRLVNRYLPQLVGRPYREGPLLPALDRFFRVAWAKLTPRGWIS